MRPNEEILTEIKNYSTQPSRSVNLQTELLLDIRTQLALLNTYLDSFTKAATAYIQYQTPAAVPEAVPTLSNVPSPPRPKKLR